VKESARFNARHRDLQGAAGAHFVIVGSFFVDRANWTPFAPTVGRRLDRRFDRVLFRTSGFDAVSTAAEAAATAEGPSRAGSSLSSSALLYIATAAVLTGLVPYYKLGTADPLAHALELLGFRRLASFMAIGAVVAMTAVLLAFQLGQPRIFMAMARDGLLPPVFGRIHPRFRTPYVGTLIAGAVVSLAPSLLTEAQALEAYQHRDAVRVRAGVTRRHRAAPTREPDRPRPFKVRAIP
jgi:APA family basic amino acid/polyamine antiporter